MSINLVVHHQPSSHLFKSRLLSESVMGGSSSTAQMKYSRNMMLRLGTHGTARMLCSVIVPLSGSYMCQRACSCCFFIACAPSQCYSSSGRRGVAASGTMTALLYFLSIETASDCWLPTRLLVALVFVLCAARWPLRLCPHTSKRSSTMALKLSSARSAGVRYQCNIK